MPKHFLIVGLPRSRTAWMASFMSDRRTVCLHEPANWRRVFDSDGPRFVGISDSGLGFQLPTILAEYQPRVLIIERPIAEVEASLDALNIGLPKTNFCQLLQTALDVITDPLIMRVSFHSLNDLRVMEKCFWHLTPGEPFDEGRFERMKNVNIQVNIAEKLKVAHMHQYSMPKGLSCQQLG